MGNMDEVIREFLIESYEGLDSLDQDLVAFESRPEDTNLLSGVFRTVHTIKGTCGFLGFEHLEAVSHAGEHLLGKLRDGHLRLTPQRTTALLALVDAVRDILGAIEATGRERERDDRELLGLLASLAETDFAAAQESEGAEQEISHATDDRRDVPNVPARSSVAETNVRVAVTVLDDLMNLVSELVLSRNQVVQYTARSRDRALVAAAQRLDRITAELQEGVMQTRMQTVANVFNRLPRLARGVAATLGKRVRLEVAGEQTELDRTLVEAIKDPLTHIVRNSIDHGIESPAQRRERNKPSEGVVSLRAFHEGGHVIVDVSDDGAGIDLQRVREKAIAAGISTPEQAAGMTDGELQNLIFHPGFSTADEITNVSGRGVGMDVVKTNIERIGGSIEMSSTAGVGTHLRIKVPLTLAIIPALLVESGRNRFAIPQVNLLELIRVDVNAIERINATDVYRLRGEILPLVHLHRHLELPDGGPVPDPGQANIVVLEADDSRFGLVVDEIKDTEEIVVKPLSDRLRSIGAFSGATVLGDGRVTLIIDALGVARHAGVVTEQSTRTTEPSDTDSHQLISQDEETSLLLCVGGLSGRVAVPLSRVERLEEFDSAAIEIAGDLEVVQYRGDIMPLVRMTDTLTSEVGDETAFEGPVQVVVYGYMGHNVGIVVDRIVDVVTERITASRPSDRNALHASIVLGGAVTDLLDLDALITASGHQFCDTSAPEPQQVAHV